MSIQEKLKIIKRNRSWSFTMPLWLTLLVPGALLWLPFTFLLNNADIWKKCLGAFIAGVALVILIYLLMRISYRMFQKRWVRIAGFLLLFVLGFIVYMQSGFPHEVSGKHISFNVFYSLHAVIHSFFPSFGGLGGEISCENCTSKILDRGWIMYFAYHTLCVFYVLMLMLSLFGRELVNSSRLWFCWKNKAVIWGFSEKGLLLALDLLCNKKCKRVVFYLDEDTLKDDDRKKIVDRLDACYCSWRDVSFSNFDESVEGESYFLISDSGKENILNAKRLLRMIRAKETGEMSNHQSEVRGKKSVRVCIRIENADEAVFYEWLDSGNIRGYADIILFKESSVATSILVDKLVAAGSHVLFSNSKDASRDEVKILLLGLGQNGQCALGDIVESAQYPGRRISVDVIEQDFEKWNLFKYQHKDFVTEYNVNRFDYDVKSEKFYTWLTSSDEGSEIRLFKYDMVVMCLGNDGLALAIMSEIRKMHKERKGALTEAERNFERQRFYIQLDNRELATFASDGEKLNLGFTPYGALSEIYSCRLLEDDIVERLAKLINWVYTKGDCDFGRQVGGRDGKLSDDCEILWNSETSFFDQQSSRASARGLIKRWKRMGYEAVLNDAVACPLNGPVVPDVETKNLAEEEHMRWMAFHFARRIRPWRLEVLDVNGRPTVVDNSIGIIDEVEKFKANQRSFDAHAALVPFADLPKVDYALDILQNGITNKGVFRVDNVEEAYAGAGKKSKNRIVSSSKKYDCMQANDYKINALLMNTKILAEVGISVRKVQKG